MEMLESEDDRLKVRAAVEELGSLEAYTHLIAENNALIRNSDLDNGRRIVRERTAIFAELTRTWAEEQQERWGYKKAFAVAALGGTGRGEMTPYSDTDFAFLFDDAIEGNEFLMELQTQVLHTRSFESRYGFRCESMPFSLDDIPELEGKQLNSFLDMRPVYDPHGLVDAFRDRIRATFDPFEHFLYVMKFWRDQWQEASFNNESLDNFDIKNDGLRIFLAGIWILGGKQFQHSHEIYQDLHDSRDLEAYEFLLRIRAFIHSRRKASRRPGAGGNHPEDVLRFEDFMSFHELLGEEADEKERHAFGNEVRRRLLSARRRVSLYSNSVIRRELRRGRVASRDTSIIYGLGGLRIETPNTQFYPAEKSQTALALLLASQRYGIDIDLMELQNSFRDAGDWLIFRPELASLFYDERGSLANTFKFLSQVEGAEERLFPGYSKFESSVDKRVMTERISLRGKMQRQKLRALEDFVTKGRATLERTDQVHSALELGSGVDVSIEAALLDSDHLAAIRLALKTKRLPVTEDDRRVEAGASTNLYDLYSSGLSGIPINEYYERYVSEAGFPVETIEIVKFLINNRSALRRYSDQGLNDERLVDEFVALCGSESRLRALFVFTSADRSEWESEDEKPARWFNIRELYTKSLKCFHPDTDPTQSLAAFGFGPDELAILKDFGTDFFGGGYRRHVTKFASHLLQLAEDPEINTPKAYLIRDGASLIVGVACRDFKGLAATITAELWKHEIGLSQAHLFSSLNHGLVLDFFHLDLGKERAPAGLTKRIEEAISGHRFTKEERDEALPKLKGNLSFREWNPEQYCLRFESEEDNRGLIYTLVSKLFRHLRANIFALSAHSSKKRAFVSVYLNLPEDLSAEEATRLIDEYF